MPNVLVKKKKLEYLLLNVDNFLYGHIVMCLDISTHTPLSWQPWPGSYPPPGPLLFLQSSKSS